MTVPFSRNVLRFRILIISALHICFAAGALFIFFSAAV